MYNRIYRPLLIVLTLVALVFVSGPASAGSIPQTQQGTPQPTQPSVQPSTGIDTQVGNFDCSQVAARGIDKQLNMRASLIRIQCGQERSGGEQSNLSAQSFDGMIASYGGADAQVNNALADTFPHVTQSTSSFAAHGNTIVAAYNSSSAAPSNYSGVSYSLDGGVTYTELRPSPFATGHGTNYGDPIVVYSNKVSQFFTFWLASGGDCGSQGIGSWVSTSGDTWALGSCVHVSSNDDREFAWVDNNPSSAYYGRIYVSWNDFNVGGGALVLAYSADNGVSWSLPVTVNASFIRNGQGVSGPDGSASLAALDEGGGGSNPRHNWIFTSPDGGNTWNATAMGSPFTAPGDISCSTYWSGFSPIWRYMGAGSLGVSPSGILHYAYTAGGSGDAGDIYYVRSTNGGLNWSAPFKLNTDAGTRAQWMPSLAVTANGRVIVSWYDRRNTSNDDYQRFARVSLDDGASWQLDQPLSDQIIPQPAQPDPNIVACYAGDYDYSATSGMVAVGGWTDGRISINSTAQQDVYADRVDFAKWGSNICTLPGKSWQLVAGLPLGAYGAAVTSDGRYVYAAGGYDLSTGDLNQFVRYNPMLNGWSNLAALPTAVDNALAAYADGKVYVFGGVASSVVQNLTQIYDIASDSWSLGAPMPEVRSHMGGGAYNGKIYLIGGYDTTSVVPGSVKDQTWVYDPSANSWSTLASMSSPLGGSASAIINGVLYIAGGRDPSNFALNTLYAYNITANSWTTRAPLPVAVNVAGGAAFGGMMWVMGGGTPFQGTSAVPDTSIDTMSNVQIYNPLANTWSAGPNQNVARSFQGAATVGRTIISVGGYNGYSSAVSESFLLQRLNVLLVFGDSPDPVTLQNQLLSLPGVGAVDLFNARFATPTPEKLRGYDVVVAWSNYPYADSVTLGNELADFVDYGGVVVDMTFDMSGVPGYELGGRWITGGYPAFNVRTATNFSTATLGGFSVPGSPLIAGVSSLSAFWRETTTAASGSSLIALWSDSDQLLAVKGQAVAVTGYFGDSSPQWSGDIGRIISNAGFSLRKPNPSCIWPSIFLPLSLRDHN